MNAITKLAKSEEALVAKLNATADAIDKLGGDAVQRAMSRVQQSVKGLGERLGGAEALLGELLGDAYLEIETFGVALPVMSRELIAGEIGFTDDNEVDLEAPLIEAYAPPAEIPGEEIVDLDETASPRRRRKTKK